MQTFEFPKAISLMFLCSTYDSGYATSLYTVGSNDQAITVDGDPTDWMGSPFFMDFVGDTVDPSLDLQGCWVEDNGTDLFVMMNTSGTLDPGVNGQVFIDNYMFIDAYIGNYTFAKRTVIEFSTPLVDIGTPSNMTISGGIRSLTTYMDQCESTYAVSEATTFDVILDNKHYPVSILSNSTVSNFNFDRTKMQVSLNATGEVGTTGYCNVTILKNLLTGNPWTIKTDDTTITDFEEKSNDTHPFLYFTYMHKDPLQVTIEGTWVTHTITTKSYGSLKISSSQRAV